MRRQLTEAHRRLRWYLDSDRGLAVLLVLLVLYVFIIYPLFGGDAFRGGPVSIAFSLLLAAGIVATATHRTLRAGIVVVAALSLASHWLHVVMGGVVDHMISAAAAMIFFALLAWYLAIRVFADGAVTGYRILGAVAVYLVLGLLWGEAYLMFYLGIPGAFAFAPGSMAFDPPVAEMVYYSFVTLTTVGYGDIVPVHPFARSLSNLEGLVGQLYPAILLARLVTQYRGHRREGE